MAMLSYDEGRPDDAQAHAEHAGLNAVNPQDTYLLALAMSLRAEIWHREDRFDEAESEALLALDAFEKLGTVDGVGDEGAPRADRPRRE